MKKVILDCSEHTSTSPTTQPGLSGLTKKGWAVVEAAVSLESEEGRGWTGGDAG